MKCDCEGWERFKATRIDEIVDMHAIPWSWTHCPWCGKALREELKPCPFCGGIPGMEKHQGPFVYRVRCMCCPVMTDWCDTEQLARAAWNRRAGGGVRSTPSRTWCE